MKCSKCNFFVILLCITLLMQISINANAQELRASDTVSRAYSKTFSYEKNALSADQGVNVSDIPEIYKKVKFNVKLSSTMQYDRSTGKYLSADTPTATLEYVGAVPLQMSSINTSKKDNGTSITFAYSADMSATVDTGFYIVQISYGRISGSFTVNK